MLKKRQGTARFPSSVVFCQFRYLEIIEYSWSEFADRFNKYDFLFLIFIYQMMLSALKMNNSQLTSRCSCTFLCSIHQPSMLLFKHPLSATILRTNLSTMNAAVNPNFNWRYQLCGRNELLVVYKRQMVRRCMISRSHHLRQFTEGMCDIRHNIPNYQIWFLAVKNCKGLLWSIKNMLWPDSKEQSTMECMRR